MSDNRKPDDKSEDEELSKIVGNQKVPLPGGSSDRDKTGLAKNLEKTPEMFRPIKPDNKDKDVTPGDKKKKLR